MKKNRFLLVGAVLALIAITVLIGCTRNSAESTAEGSQLGAKATVNPKGKGRIYYDLFNTVSYIYSYSGDSDEEFMENCDELYALLLNYHRLFDIYYEYSGMNNLCTVNKNAGGSWVDVEPLLIEFLLFAQEMEELTEGEMNIMMGSVLKLWHDARVSDHPYLPLTEDLTEAQTHTGFEFLEIDEENSRVRITDERASIDVGALGKGYAAEKGAEYLESKGITSYVLNLGGNIRIIGTKADGSGWVTGIRNPLNPEGDYASSILISDSAVVTSGNYEQYFTVEGKKYSHIIDKDTLMPSEYYASLTVVTKNSGLADCLSTALYCMPYEKGVKLVEGLEGVEALWIFPDGSMKMSDGFRKLVV